MSQESGIAHFRASGGPLRALAAAAALLLAGCSSDNLAPAEGIVRVASRPAVGGRVVFLPVGGGKPAIGEIEPNGHFTLTTGGRKAGATVASHHIVLKDVRCEGESDSKNYRATEATRVAVGADAPNRFELNVDLKSGWLLILDN